MTTASVMTALGRRIVSSSPVLPYFLFVCLVLVGPFAWIAQAAFEDRELWGQLVSDPNSRQVLVRTAIISAQTTVICVVIGYFFAAAMRAASPRVRALLIAVITLPFLTSYLVRTYGWLILLGANGPINQSLREIFGQSVSVDLLYNRAGVLIGMVHVLLPLFVLPLYAVWSRVPSQLELASHSLGAGRVETFLRVSLPLSIPGAAAGALLVFVSATGFFITPALLGGQSDRMVAQVINEDIENFVDLEAAAVMSIAVVLVVALLLMLFRTCYPLESLIIPDDVPPGGRRGSRRSALSVALGLSAARVSAARARLMRILDRLPWTTLRNILVIATVIFLLAPLVVLFPVAFSGDAYLQFPPQSYSLRWFEAVAADPEWRSTAANSLITGGMAIALTVVVGVPLSFFLARARGYRRLKALLTVMVMLPVLVPVVVTALGMFNWFLELQVIGRVWSLSFAHASLGLPFLVLVAASALRDFDTRVEDAARSLGASRSRALWNVTLPLIGAAIASGCLFAFLQSFDELLIAMAVTTPDTQTLPVKMWNGANEELSPALAAVSVLMLAVTVLALLLIAVLNSFRKRTRSGR